MILIDDYSRITWVTFLRENNDTLDKFKAFKSMIENGMDMKIKCLRSEKGGDFTSNDFNMFCEAHGIKRQLCTPRSC
jgi:hypothetical protein